MLVAVGSLAMAPMPTGKGQPLQREEAVVDIPEQVQLLGVFLKGRYLIVHDDSRMAQGGDCTYVYTQEKGKPNKLVVSFHCTPVARETSDHFVVRTARISNALDTRRVTEIQFAGSNEAHRIPTD
jgi:hypothetical protein